MKLLTKDEISMVRGGSYCESLAGEVENLLMWVIEVCYSTNKNEDVCPAAQDKYKDSKQQLQSACKGGK